MHFAFWHRWLLVASLFFTGFGIVAAVASDSFFFEFWTHQIDHTFFGAAPFGGEIPTEAG